MFFTDPARTPDPEAVAARLPRGAAVVYRAFGAPDALARARRLRAICKARGLVLLIGADEGLAQGARADGVHLPQRLAARAGRIKRAHPSWIVTAAAHGEAAARRAARAGADAAVVSPVFPSRSPSAGRPLGVMRLSLIARRAGVPVYALGGVSNENARRLVDAGVAGLAAVEGLASRT
ncbi:MAG: thiamine phosphate synthase [Phenylobacterium sp.]|uniref:thiamine phosphate synthase n=1 Tax=Phenylobacterium sp. TaxID=1871053 RepID=UPI00391B22F3